MTLYYVHAREAEDGTIGPALPEVEGLTWVGVFDEESGMYVVKTDVELPDTRVLAAGEDVGFDYSGLETSSVYVAQPADLEDEEEA